MGFLSSLAYIAPVALVLLAIVPIKKMLYGPTPRKKKTAPKESSSFRARREKGSRGSYLVHVSYEGKRHLPELSCALDGYTGFTSYDDSVSMKTGKSAVLAYTPSLADEHPTHVVVSWWKKGTPRSATVQIA